MRRDAVRGTWFLALGLAAVIAGAGGLAQKSYAATAEERAYALPGAVHEGAGQPLAQASSSGLLDTVGTYLAQEGRGPATIASIVVTRQMSAVGSRNTVIDFTQQINGMDVYGVHGRAIFNAAGDLIAMSENLVAVGPVMPAAVAARQALDAAVENLHRGESAGLRSLGQSGNRTSFGGNGFFHRNPTVTDVVVANPGGALQRGFLVETWSQKANELHYSLVGGNGQVLDVRSRTANDQYNVFTENPGVTPQGIEVGPDTGNAESPSGWLSGSQTTINIKGNNANAYLDANNNNAPDSGGSSVGDGHFNTSADLTVQPYTAGNQAVAVQNLFYINNVVHDILYAGGFDEAAGNFQENNFASGGSGSDSVNAEAQDGGGLDNANFATPSDGSNPRMQMYLWNGKGDHLVTLSPNTYFAMGADFGPDLTTTGVSGSVAATTPADACSAVGGSLSGKIAVIDRGNCNFTVKVKNAQNAGAAGAIVVNYDGVEDIIAMGGSDGTITIPSVFVGHTDGVAIKSTGGSATIAANPNPPLKRDGSLDGDIVFHEYGHGLTWRIVDNMTGMMGGAIGEGMSDALAIIHYDNPVVGEYAASTGAGIRSAPYDTWLEDTGRTYEDFVNQVHADGEIYAAIMWTLWEHYRDDDGIAEPESAILADLIDGMKLTTYNLRPTFDRMRDGILTGLGWTADASGVLAVPPPSAEGTVRGCYVWDAFAKYGVGTDQSTTVTGNNFVVSYTWFEGFSQPATCGTPLANQDPVAAFSFSTNNLTATFTDASSDSDGSVATWSWNFGDGGTSTQQNPSHTYAAGATYTVSLTVTDNLGATSNVSQQDVTVSEPAVSDVVTITSVSYNSKRKRLDVAATNLVDGAVLSLSAYSDTDGKLVISGVNGLPMGYDATSDSYFLRVENLSTAPLSVRVSSSEGGEDLEPVGSGGGKNGGGGGGGCKGNNPNCP